MLLLTLHLGLEAWLHQEFKTPKRLHEDLNLSHLLPRDLPILKFYILNCTLLYSIQLYVG